MHGEPTSAAQRGASLVPSPVIAQAGLALLLHTKLASLQAYLGDEVVDTGLGRNRLGGDGLSPSPSPCEWHLPEFCIRSRIPGLRTSRERRRQGCRRPCLRRAASRLCAKHCRRPLANRTALPCKLILYRLNHRAYGALADGSSIREIESAHTGRGGEIQAGGLVKAGSARLHAQC